MSVISISPRLFADFCCIAEKCPSNCCAAGWNITWTEEEFARLRSAECGKLCSDVGGCFIGSGYKTIKLNERGECPFLSEDGLCRIQRDLGEKYLSYTCRKYPRISRLCGEVLLSSCKPTCYAVLDRLLYDSECMQTGTSHEYDEEAIITHPDEASCRMEFYGLLKDILYNNDIDAALSIAAESNGIKLPQDIKGLFKAVSGFEILSGNENYLSQLPDYAGKNLIYAVFLEWTIVNYCCTHTLRENIAAFIFCSKAILAALDGLQRLTDDKSELLCSLGDFIAAVTSDNAVIDGILSYSQDTSLVISNILHKIENIF